ADHHSAALPVGERAVLLVLDDVETVEQRRLLGRVELVLLQGAVARRGVVTPDLESDPHAGLRNLALKMLDRACASAVSEAGGAVTEKGSPKFASVMTPSPLPPLPLPPAGTRRTYPSSLPTQTSKVPSPLRAIPW